MTTWHLIILLLKQFDLSRGEFMHSLKVHNSSGLSDCGHCAVESFIGIIGTINDWNIKILKFV